MTPASPPDGYVRVAVGAHDAVVRPEHEDDARALLAAGSLYAAAAADPLAQPLAGRGVAYAVRLPRSGARAVVRHNRHGGTLAALTRDLFLPPTRAPYELAASLRLQAAGVATPQLLMYAVERVAGLLRRADVVTREVAGGRDLAAYMMPGEPAAARAEAWRATRALVASLDAAGARHHDLNVKNVLLAPDQTGTLVGWVLDVDRVEFGVAGSQAVSEGNLARLARSARKWRDQRGAAFDERELAAVVSARHRALSVRP